MTGTAGVTWSALTKGLNDRSLLTKSHEHIRMALLLRLLCPAADSNGAAPVRIKAESLLREALVSGPYVSPALLFELLTMADAAGGIVDAGFLAAAAYRFQIWELDAKLNLLPLMLRAVRQHCAVKGSASATDGTSLLARLVEMHQKRCEHSPAILETSVAIIPCCLAQLISTVEFPLNVDDVIVESAAVQAPPDVAAAPGVVPGGVEVERAPGPEDAGEDIPEDIESASSEAASEVLDDRAGGMDASASLLPPGVQAPPWSSSHICRGAAFRPAVSAVGIV